MDINIDLLTAIIGAIGVFVAARLSSRGDTISGAADYVKVLLDAVQDKDQAIKVKDRQIMTLRIGVHILTLQIIKLGEVPKWEEKTTGGDQGPPSVDEAD